MRIAATTPNAAADGFINDTHIPRRRKRSSNAPTGSASASATSQRRRRFQMSQTTAPNSRYPFNLVTLRFGTATPAAQTAAIAPTADDDDQHAPRAVSIAPRIVHSRRRRFASGVRLATMTAAGSASARNGNAQTRVVHSRRASSHADEDGFVRATHLQPRILGFVRHGICL